MPSEESGYLENSEVARLDAVCDEYKRALWEGEGRVPELEEYLDRVHPEERDRLREMLGKIRSKYDLTTQKVEPPGRRQATPVEPNDDRLRDSARKKTPIYEGAEPIPGYRLIEPLGRGGYGEVWSAEAPGRILVALKFIVLGRAKPELRALDSIKSIRHPNLLSMQFAMEVGGYLIVGTELCDGSLRDRLRDCLADGMDGIPVEELLGYVSESARAIDFLNAPRHRAADGSRIGVQHRDIKPENIFLMGRSVKLADFGLAMALEGTVATHSGAMTPAYAAPEVFEGKVAVTSDQYSLAISYYELRTGKLPFVGTPNEMMYGHLHREPDLWLVAAAEREILRKALAKNPRDRWKNCEEFVAKLRSAVESDRSASPDDESEPEAVPRVPSPDWGNRLRSAALIATGVILFAFAGALAVRWLRPNSPSRVPSEQPQASPADESGKPQPPDFLVAPFDAQEIARARSAWSSYLGKPEELTIGDVKLVLIPGGEFMMGSTEAEARREYEGLLSDTPEEKKDRVRDRFDRETPAHRVRLSEAFYVSETEITRGQFRKFVETTDYKTDCERDGEGGWGLETKDGRSLVQDEKFSWRDCGFSQSDDHPVVNVSWNDAMAYCKWQGVRLLTEAEWEYCCRGGSVDRYCFGDDAEGLTRYGNVADASHETQWNLFVGKQVRSSDGYVYTSPVKKYLGNAFGLYDVHGNVREWCADWYGDYEPGLSVNPTGPPEGSFRVGRGGSWSSLPRSCRSADRGRYSPDDRDNYLGFRVALSSDGAK